MYVEFSGSPIFLHPPFRPQTATLQTAPPMTFPVALSTSFHAVPARFSGMRQLGSPGVRPFPPRQADAGSGAGSGGVGGVSRKSSVRVGNGSGGGGSACCRDLRTVAVHLVPSHSHSVCRCRPCKIYLAC